MVNLDKVCICSLDERNDYNFWCLCVTAANEEKGLDVILSSASDIDQDLEKLRYASYVVFGSLCDCGHRVVGTVLGKQA